MQGKMLYLKDRKENIPKYYTFFINLSVVIHDYIVNGIGEEQVADITNQLLLNEAYKTYFQNN